MAAPSTHPQGRQVPDQDGVPVLARGLLGRHRGLGDGHVGGVAGDQADGGAGPLEGAAAMVFGRYPSSAAAARIRSSVSVETRTSPPLRTLLAVWKLTPARPRLP